MLHLSFLLLMFFVFSEIRAGDLSLFKEGNQEDCDSLVDINLENTPVGMSPDFLCRDEVVYFEHKINELERIRREINTAYSKQCKDYKLSKVTKALLDKNIKKHERICQRHLDKVATFGVGNYSPYSVKGYRSVTQELESRKAMVEREEVRLRKALSQSRSRFNKCSKILRIEKNRLLQLKQDREEFDDELDDQKTVDLGELNWEWVVVCDDELAVDAV